MIHHFDKKSSPFHLAYGEKWQARGPNSQLQKETCEIEKHTWIFKASELMQEFKIKNIRLITDRDTAEEFIFLDSVAKTMVSTGDAVDLSGRTMELKSKRKKKVQIVQEDDVHNLVKGGGTKSYRMPGFEGIVRK